MTEQKIERAEKDQSQWPNEHANCVLQKTRPMR
jgi:hypothetical protein